MDVLTYAHTYINTSTRVAWLTHAGAANSLSVCPSRLPYLDMGHQALVQTSVLGTYKFAYARVSGHVCTCPTSVLWIVKQLVFKLSPSNSQNREPYATCFACIRIEKSCVFWPMRKHLKTVWKFCVFWPTCFACISIWKRCEKRYDENSVFLFLNAYACETCGPHGLHETLGKTLWKFCVFRFHMRMHVKHVAWGSAFWEYSSQSTCCLVHKRPRPNVSHAYAYEKVLKNSEYSSQSTCCVCRNTKSSCLDCF
jgi:hypothetical protein